MGKDTFDVLVLVARPAAGKSEIIDYLQKTDLETRRARFHVGELDVIDDFPMLWAWFEEDNILSRMGKPRLHSDEEGYFKYPYLWHVLIERVSLEYGKRLRDRPNYHDHFTTVIEFSRGTEHGGYGEAFPHLSCDILQRAAIVYINVSFDESRRKNRRRFNPNRPDSVLEHALPDRKLERLYREDDWGEFSASDPEFVAVKEIRLPYVVFENEDDVTTARGEALGRRLEKVLGQLWTLKAQTSELQTFPKAP
jgi:hypothetical protein